MIKLWIMLSSRSIRKIFAAKFAWAMLALVLPGWMSWTMLAGEPGKARDMREPAEFDYEVRLGWAGIPLMDAVMFYDGYSPFAVYDVSWYHPTSMESIYRGYRGPGYMTGIISAEVDFNFKRWFALTLGLGFNGMYQDVYDTMTGRKAGCNRGVSVSVLPEARFNWLNRGMVRMYSSAGLGIVLGVQRNVDYGNSNFVLYPAVQFTPAGISVGRRVYGFVECGVGTQFTGGMAGVGVRF